MAVEGFSRVPQGQAGTGEAFLLGESKALNTYVKQEQDQIAAKQKADKDAVEWKPEEIGWIYEEQVGNEYASYKQDILDAQARGEDIQSLEFKKRRQKIEDQARQSVSNTKRYDVLSKMPAEELFGKEEAKYYDKSVYMKNFSKKLSDENGNLLSPDKVKGLDLADTKDPDSFMTPLYVNDFVKDIKDQLSIEGSRLKTQGYGQYIITEGDKVRFADGTNADGSPKAGVNDQVGQLLLDHPIYNEVTSKKVQRDMDEMVQQKMAAGMSEIDAKSEIYSNKDKLMMAYAKDDIGAYQQVSKTSDTKLGLNVGQTKASIMNAEASKQNAKTNEKAQALKGKQYDDQKKSRANADPSLTPTDYTGQGGAKVNILGLGNLSIPAEKTGKDGKNQPLTLNPTSVFYIDGAGGQTESANLSIRGKSVNGTAMSAQDRSGSGTADYIPMNTKAVVTDSQGRLVSYNDPDSKTNTDDMKEFYNKDGYTVNLMMEAQEVVERDDKGKPTKFRTVLIPITNANGGSEMLNYNNFSNLDEAQNAIQEAARTQINWGNKSSMQGFGQKKKKSTTSTFGNSNSSSSNSADTGGDFD